MLPKLENFVAEMAKRHEKGLQLHEIVRLAVVYGYHGENHGENHGDLTQAVNQSLKKLLHQGTLVRDNSMKITVRA